MIKNVEWSIGLPLFPVLGRVSLIVLILFSLADCPVPVPPGGDVGFLSFRIRPADGGAFYTVNVQKLAEGSRGIVFADQKAAISAGLAWNIAAEFDSNIYPKISGTFGDYMAAGFDVDGNKKLALLLVDIRDGYTGSGGYVAGYFDPTHLLDTANSNRMDMLFIDVYPQVPGSSDFYTTIAHELQHLINYAIHGGGSQEIWLNEGLSAAAEYLYGGEQQGRIDYFNADYNNTIVYGNNFFVWDGYWEKVKGDVLANYATAYLFFRWLGIQGGPGIYTAMAGSPYMNYQAVTEAVKGGVTEAVKDKIAGVTGGMDDPAIWRHLLSSWMIANLVNAPEGPFGYNNRIVTKVWGFEDDTIQVVNLYPGEGVYSSLEGKSLTGDDVAGSGFHIKYVGIGGTTQNPVIIEDSLLYTGTVLLTYNANPNLNNGSEKGFIMSYSGGLLSLDPAGASAAAGFSGTGFAGTGAAGARSALPSGTPPLSYPIGIHDLRTLRSAERAGTR
jgi:hypothetical protein